MTANPRWRIAQRIARAAPALLFALLFAGEVGAQTQARGQAQAQAAQAQAQAQAQSPAPAPAQARSAASAPQAVPVAEAEANWHYRVVPGDTLIGLADNFLQPPNDWRSLQRLNRVADPYHLAPGTDLRIPLIWLRKTATVAEAVFVQGTVTVQRDAANAGAAVETGANLSAGDVIRTEADSSISLRFADGSRLLVTPNSRVTIQRLLAYGRSQIPSIRLQLDDGGADSRVVPNSNKGRAYEIETPAVNLGVRGTEFRARFDADLRTAHVEVLEGRVGAATGRSESPVAAGYGATATVGGVLSALRPLLAKPDLTGMATTIEKLPPRLNWPPLASARSYRAEVYGGPDADQLMRDGVFTAPAARWADLPDGNYRIRIRGIDAEGIEGIDATAAFVVAARPEPPFTTQPASGTSLHGRDVTFGWTKSTAAASYRLQIATTEDFAEPLADRADITDDHLVEPLSPGSYFWRIRSVTAEGRAGPFGDAQPFVLRALPPDPATEPPQSAPDGVLLRWRAPEGGQSVQYQVATDADFSHIVVDEHTDRAEGLWPHPAPGHYFIRARTVDADGFAGDFGAPQQMTVPAHLSKWWLLIPAGFLWLVVM